MFKLDKLVVLARNRIQHPALAVFLWIAYLYA